jgi:RHS repeat-associated protein
LELTCQSLPYGNGENCTPTALGTAEDPTEQHFTGKERDTESGNDYFGARYYASSMGRWMSPDKPFADQHAANPQSWNLYSYTRNNPLRFVDDDGRVVVETRTTTYYPVSGATANEALANANSHSFGSSGDHAGLTSSSQSWSTNTSYTYQTTDANVTVTTTVTSDTITLNQNVQLPQWDGYSKASPEDQKTWDDATSKLQGHETDHENINRAGADALDKSLPGTTSSATGKSLDPTVKASQNNNDAAVQSKADANQQTTNQNNQHLDACTSNGTQACK